MSTEHRSALMSTEQRLQWVAVPGGLLAGRPAAGHRRHVPPAAHRRGHHPGALPRPARLAGDRGGRDLAVDADGTACRPRSSARPRSPTCGRRCSRPRPRWRRGSSPTWPTGRWSRTTWRRCAPSCSASTPGPLRRHRTRCRRCAPGGTSSRWCGAWTTCCRRWSGPGQTRYGELERRLGVTGAAGRLLSAARAQSAARKAAGVRGGPAIHPLPPGSVFEVERAALFHSSPEPEPREMPADGEHYRASVDVHQMISSLGEHPDLLRRLGLVVDLAVPADALPAPTGSVTATPLLAAPADAVVRSSVAHRTAYRADGGRFVAARQAPDPAVPEGLVPLSAAGFFVNQVDVDGAALKTIATATTATTPPPAPGGAALHQPDEARAERAAHVRPLARADRSRGRAAGRAEPQRHRRRGHRGRTRPSCTPRTWCAAIGWTCSTSWSAPGARCTSGCSPPPASATRRASTRCRARGTCRSASPSA